MLSEDALTRYARQLILPEVGVAGQERLGRARVLVVGAGGLGSPVALYLAAAGVGTLGIVDDDRIELSNLHRQILHATKDVSRPKSQSAAIAIERLNPSITVEAHGERVTTSNADALISQYDLVVDGSDNYSTRYTVNDSCARLGKPWIYGSVERFAGQVSVFGTPGGPCYRCLFPEPPPPDAAASCEQIGVLGAVPGVIGTLQATETLKWILGIGEPLVGRMLVLDLMNTTVQAVEFERRPDCPACGSRADDRANSEHPIPRSARDGNGHGTADFNEDIEPAELARRIAARTDFDLLDIREPWEWEVSRIGEPRLLPMNELPSALPSLDADREIVVYCHHGARSQIAAEWLRSQGFRARNLLGGIDRWSREVDPAVRRY